jgi:hypothetical protein
MASSRTTSGEPTTYEVPPPRELKRERKALLEMREERLRDLGGLALEMYKRDRFNAGLVVERCAELVAIEARVQEIDALLDGTALVARRRRCSVYLWCADPPGREVLCDVWTHTWRQARFQARRWGSGSMTTCANCGGPLATGQEYCLVCGVRSRSPGFARPSSGSTWTLRVLAAGAVAVIGGVAAVAATGSDGGRETVITAIGGFATAPATAAGDSSVGPSGVAEWPIEEDGWTIALASVPQTTGRAVALGRAKAARRKGLPQVGVLDSSRYASLHPGYWIVFSGVYASEAEATSALEEARDASRTAVVRRVVP